MRFVMLSFTFLAAFSLACRADATVPENLELPPAAGTEQPFKLADHAGQYVALHFLLKTECPICARHTQTYLRRAGELAGVHHVFIKPDAEKEIEAWAAKIQAASPIPVHRDPNAQLAKQLAIPGGYKFHGESVHYPALVLLGPAGDEVFRYVGQSNSDRYSFDQLKEKLGELRQPTGLAHYHLPDDGNLALKGYDPVAYFTQNAAAEGSPDITSQYQGITYRFATAENRALFNANPEKYLPTYGGWCATAMADGEKVDIDPESFAVTDGRLFLFYDGLWGDAKKKWNKKPRELEQKADAAWQKLTQ